jgi:hypothetical protein
MLAPEAGEEKAHAVAVEVAVVQAVMAEVVVVVQEVLLKSLGQSWI